MITKVKVERQTVYACSGVGTFKQSIRTYAIVRIGNGSVGEQWDKLVKLDDRIFRQYGSSLKGYSKGARRPLWYEIIEYINEDGSIA